MQDRPAPASLLLWGLLAVSLLLNVVVIAVLFVAVMAGRQAAAGIADQLAAFGRQDIRYQFRIVQTVPVTASVPFHHTAIVPYSQSLPISTTVTITKELPVIGQISFDIPIEARVPVSLSIPVAISGTIPVQAAVPLNLEIPLDIPVADTPLKTTIDNAVKALNNLAGR